MTVTLNDGVPVYVALARVSGTTDNTLEYTPNAVREEGPVPTAFALLQNYPNPFNPATTISYRLAGTAQVVLNVYNLLGQQVRTLVNERQAAGTYNVRFDADGLPGGFYVCRLTAGEFSGITRMLLVR